MKNKDYYSKKFKDECLFEYMTDQCPELEEALCASLKGCESCISRFVELMEQEHEEPIEEKPLYQEMWEKLGYKEVYCRSKKILSFEQVDGNSDVGVDFDLTKNDFVPYLNQYPRELNMDELKAVIETCKYLGWFDDEPQ